MKFNNIDIDFLNPADDSLENTINAVAQQLEILHVPGVERSEFGNPFVDKLFEVAQKVAKNEVCCYINSDIIPLNDFIESVRLVASKKKKFLLIGKRFDLNVKEVKWTPESRQKSAEFKLHI